MATAKSIKESLIRQLIDNDADVEHYRSLVDDYVWYWKQEKAMQKDVKEKGCTYEATSAAGKKFEKENPSVKNAVLYNKQKLTILKELGLSIENVVSDEDDEL
ncbi:P27 family phage terminase small subunit [Clostridium sp. WILCCON 0269]|uniref:P27 family phage terminase small subunit n=1 Tax=Candidatus Clostridium eludens TaxID=3381663 RepID=A0ABW8SM61_9CLOT